MAKVEGAKALVAKLNGLAEKAKEAGVSVVVGFTQEYALPVHENLEAKHPVGSAKFLERPFRDLSSDGTLATIVHESLKRGASMEQALLLAGLRVQRDAQLETPVLTGALRASAYTRVED